MPEPHNRYFPGCLVEAFVGELDSHDHMLDHICGDEGLPIMSNPKPFCVKSTETLSMVIVCGARVTMVQEVWTSRIFY